VTVSRRGFVAGAALAIALPAAARAATKTQSDATTLAAAVDLEQVAAYVYSAGVHSGLLDAGLAAAVQNLADHEQAHADALAADLEALGGARPAAPASAEDGDAALKRLGIGPGLRSLADAPAFLTVALALEQRQLALYSEAVGEIEDIRLIQTYSSIVAAEGQHLVVIRNALGRAPVPKSFETGRP
jgi:rubrerythrin